MTEEFIGDPLAPVRGQTNAHHATVGAPHLPGKFLWRGKEIVVDEVIEVWKENSPCKSGSSESYLRKHWFKIRATNGDTMTIYFERQARSAREKKKRWWLYTVSR